MFSLRQKGFICHFLTSLFGWYRKSNSCGSPFALMLTFGHILPDTIVCEQNYCDESATVAINHSEMHSLYALAPLSTRHCSACTLLYNWLAGPEAAGGVRHLCGHTSVPHSWRGRPCHKSHPADSHALYLASCGNAAAAIKGLEAKTTPLEHYTKVLPLLYLQNQTWLTVSKWRWHLPRP